MSLAATYPYYLANEPEAPNHDLEVLDKYTGEVATRVALADDAVRRKRVGLISGEDDAGSRPLTSSLHFLRKALEPTAEVVEGTLSETATELRMTVAGFEGGKGGIDMRVTSERIGECPGEAK